MAAFEYLALDGSGRETRGITEAVSERLARQQLRADGLVPLELEQVAKRHERNTEGKLSTTDLALITRQIAALLTGGVPLGQALAVIARQAHRPRNQKILLGLRAKISEGHSFADSLRVFPNVFSEAFTATVEAGEHSGQLEEVLKRLASYAELRDEVRQKVLAAMLYPLILVVVSLSIVLGLVAYVVPQVLSVFENTGQSLPLLTRWLMIVSNFLISNSTSILVCAVAGGAALSVSMRTKVVRVWLDRVLLSLPLASTLIRSINMVTFGRTLGALITSGVPAVEALRITGAALPSPSLQSAVRDAQAHVREGRSLHSALSDTEMFPPIMLEFIATGEDSGGLGELLEIATDNQERELTGALGTFLVVLEPLLILLVGGLVLMVVLGVLLPIFQLNQLIAP